MLNDVREALVTLPDKDFAEFYQEYVIESQDAIIQHDVDIASKDYISIEDTCEVIKGLNKLTEELRLL